MLIKVGQQFINTDHVVIAEVLPAVGTQPRTFRLHLIGGGALDLVGEQAAAVHHAYRRAALDVVAIFHADKAAAPKPEEPARDQE